MIKFECDKSTLFPCIKRVEVVLHGDEFLFFVCALLNIYVTQKTFKTIVLFVC